MASKAQQALSANLAALSYALELAGKTENAPLEVRVGSGTRPGPLQRRRQDPEIASPDEMSLEFEPGKPFKNFGRLLAHSAGIPLPYNMRQSSDAAEQARIDYENENTFVGEMGDTFLEQMEENASRSKAGGWQERSYRQYAAQGRDALAAFFAQDASPEQRAAARERLTALDERARLVRDADANDEAKYARQHIGGELATSRAALINLDMAERDRVMSFESELAQLENVKPGSTEEQVVLRTLLATGIQRSQNGLATAASTLGGTAMLTANPYGVAAGAALQVAGAVLANETAKLDRDTVIKMRLEMNDTMDRLTEEFRPELVRLHEHVAGEGASYGIPSSSWATERIELDTPYADAYRQRLFGEGGGSRGPDAPAPPAEPAAAVAPQLSGEGRGAGRGLGGRRPTR